MAIFPPGVYPTLPATTFVLELNPNAGSKYRIRDIGGVGTITHTTDIRYGDPLDNNSALADVIRRARKYQGTPQAIEVGPGCTFNQTWIGGIDTNKDPVAWWAPTFSSPANQFEPIRDVHLYAADPVNGRPRLNGWEMSVEAKNNSGGSFNLNRANGLEHGPFSIRGFDIHSNGGEYAIHTALGKNQSYGKFGFYDIQLVGEAGSFGAGGILYDCDMFCRVAYGQWELIDVVAVGAAREHFWYCDAVQGDSIFANCFSGPGLAGAPGNGRTMFQFAQRASEGANQNGPIEGSNDLFGFGTLWVCDNLAIGCGRQGGHAFTFVGNLGEIRCIDNEAREVEGGAFLWWSDWAKSIHTTAGLFLTDPMSPKLIDMPISGTAFNFAKVVADGLTCSQSTPWPNPRIPIRFAGIGDLEIGAFDATFPSAVRTMAFWLHNTSNVAQDPLDNGAVKFLSAKVGPQVSQYTGWEPTKPKATYGSAGNNNQPLTGAQMTNANLDALVDDDGTFYPPWFQAGPGTVNPGAVTPLPLSLSLSLPDVAATLPTTQVVTPDPLALQLSTPEVGTVVPVTISLAPPLRLGLRYAADLAVILNVSVRPLPLRTTLQIPTVDADGGPVAVAPLPLEMALSTPDVDTEVLASVAPDPLDLTLSTPSVGVTADSAVPIDPLALSLSTPDVATDAPASVAPSPLRMGLRTPVVSAGATIFVGPDPLALQLSTPLVGLEALTSIEADPLALQLSTPPVDLGGEFLQPAPAVLTLVIPSTPLGDAPEPIVFEVMLLASALEIDTAMATTPPVWSGSTVKLVGVFTQPSGPEAGQPQPIGGTTLREIILEDPNGLTTTYVAGLTTDGSDGKIEVERPLSLAGAWKVQGHVSGGGLDLFSAVVQFTVQHSLQT